MCRTSRRNLTDKKFPLPIPEIWGGIECTVNRVGDSYRDQLKYAGHYSREGDLEAIASLGIKKLRFPILWEQHVQEEGGCINWDWTSKQLDQLTSLGVQPIAGLLHHGSGPVFTDLMDPLFPEKFAAYALEVAEKFPWLEYYTPINEPLTTARFSGLYGLWYPHESKGKSFARMLINQCRGIILAMKAIRSINPHAKLLQTEDLGKTYSTPALEYQARFENTRRWLSYDLICGKVNKRHSMRGYLLRLGITKEELDFFLTNPFPPDIMGFNYYITSERFLDNNLVAYPGHIAGGNGRHSYVDIEAVRVPIRKSTGLRTLIREAWKRFHIPIAITEVHIGCTREEQLRWLYETWNTSQELLADGITIVAVTPWALLGSFDWNSLLTRENLHYETGAFDVSGGILRSTALAPLILSMSKGQLKYDHPLLEQKGWWHHESRFFSKVLDQSVDHHHSMGKPLVIIGKSGTLARAFSIITALRSIPIVCLSREDVNIYDEQALTQILKRLNPWAVVNCAGYVNVDMAEREKEQCMMLNTTAPTIIAAVCDHIGIPFMTFSSDLVFGGDKKLPYTEADIVNPLSVYGESKARAEELVLKACSKALVIRSSAFFGPWDKYNFVYNILQSLGRNNLVEMPSDVTVSPTYLPDLVNYALDLLIDKVHGIWHIANSSKLSWADFAIEVARQGDFEDDQIISKKMDEMQWAAQRPLNSALETQKGIGLPSLDNALERYFKEAVKV